ncbi:MAG: hypothetical protein UX37_C0001G0021 [Microgenomates group bacterium GW2011_GWA2_46_16]|nr:MAG: hypothetical protein UX37_C0001G0021 [Microgenomates group bacterium GW2011_GWA2_46_16]
MESEIEEVGRKLAILETRKNERLHFDVGDGLFSELMSVTPTDLHQFDLTKMKIDIHLLVDDPMEWVEGCSILSPQRLIAQIERMGSQIGFLDGVKNYGISGGLALQIETPIESIEEGVFAEVQTILLLAIPPGTTGHVFDERILDKIKELKQIYRGNILIDGGVTPAVYQRVQTAGASEAGSNSAYWRGDFSTSLEMTKYG